MANENVSVNKQFVIDNFILNHFTHHTLFNQIILSFWSRRYYLRASVVFLPRDQRSRHTPFDTDNRHRAAAVAVQLLCKGLRLRTTPTLSSALIPRVALYQLTMFVGIADVGTTYFGVVLSSTCWYTMV